MSVFRIYVEKKPDFAVEAHGVYSDVRTALRIHSLKGIRIINRYDVEGLSESDFQLATPTVFSEPPVDNVFYELPDFGTQKVFAAEYLPGQFDQRADSCEQCIQILTQGERPRVRTARIYVLDGDLSNEEFETIKHYIINPVESREASLATYDTLDTQYQIPTTVELLKGFIELNEEQLNDFIKHYGLAMDLDDIKFCQNYFKNDEKRDPTITEIRMIDTYWSDHCRHTTFSTNIENVNIDADYIQDTYQTYLNTREELYVGRNKPITLMDLATIGAKKLKKDGLLKDLDESEEINACSVKIDVDVDGKTEKWLLMFKNETHNHPTEIEPFGGAATCLGGAIRDPLSGRSYVYQAMRVTGASNPLVSTKETIAGKLPQRKITVGAAQGYSSYGNQIGLATGQVAEVYHPGYVAKRLEIGAVVGAAPEENVIRIAPSPSDVIILLGGKTGRDGCGGATGSSKSHTMESLETCGAEVQKGNPPEERKLQRLFRNPKATRLIKRCNDFGAGGVSVAIGELADGLEIDLDAVPKKYEGLDGTELAISESQERMAVVVDKKDVDAFIALASEENLLATKVAVVTEEPRLKMNWCGNQIVNLSREFLNSNGAPKYTDISIEKPEIKPVNRQQNTAKAWKELLTDLNVCSQKGLVERFDSTIGASSVLMPYGGTLQLTPSQAMAAKIPVLHGETNTSSLMAWGFNPNLSAQSPYHGAIYAVVESVAKLIATGGSYKKCWLTFQEYFERTQNNPARWGKPAAALLGALKAQLELGIGAIGGKDSMSGTFEDIDVPPTLVSFAVSVADAAKVVSPEFKQAQNRVSLIIPKYDENGLPDFDDLKRVFDEVEAAIESGIAKSVWALGYGGVAEGISKMCFGNNIGFKFIKSISDELMFNPVYGGFLIEISGDHQAKYEDCILGVTTGDPRIHLDNGEIILVEDLVKATEAVLEPVFPLNITTQEKELQEFSFVADHRVTSSIKVAKPRVLIPVFPGTNCEYDTARVFERAGAIPEIFVIKNLSSKDIQDAVEQFAKLIQQSQIIMIPGGFSGGDEPDGSGKFITSFFRNPMLKDAVNELLKQRDGLMLGICNGFQALIKLGLVPFGEIIEQKEDSPTLTFNSIGRHQSMMVTTKICSTLSPWLANTEVGDVHRIAISHGEGRFIASPELIKKLAENGQIATQYINLNGHPTNHVRYNPNDSFYAIEGITSPDGRVFGKMGHSERIGSNVCKNIPGNKDQKIFESGVQYFA